MDIENLRREGFRPAIMPNAGVRRTLCWTREDAGRFGETLKKAFPNVLFYKPLRYRRYQPEQPTIEFFDRLDGLEVDTCAEAIFPYPGWKPELVWEKWTTTGQPSWDWAHYLSPIITMHINTYDRVFKREWRDGNAEHQVETYLSCDISTSYRRQIAEESRIQAKVVRLADKMCIRTVAVVWMSYADFVAGRGKIWDKKKVHIRHVTKNVLDRYRAAPGRTLDLALGRDGWGIGYVPIDEIPEDWWNRKLRPKWAQR